MFRSSFSCNRAGVRKSRGSQKLWGTAHILLDEGEVIGVRRRCRRDTELGQALEHGRFELAQVPCDMRLHLGHLLHHHSTESETFKGGKISKSRMIARDGRVEQGANKGNGSLLEGPRVFVKATALIVIIMLIISDNIILL